MNEICIGKINHLVKEQSITLPLDVSHHIEQNHYFHIRLGNDKEIILTVKVDAFRFSQQSTSRKIHTFTVDKYSECALLT